MKLKQLPEDFIVEEIPICTPKQDGLYRYYLLEKRGIETLSLLNYLAKKEHIPFPAIGFAGLKDKHAITKQYLTIPKKYTFNSLQEKNFKLSFLGFVEEPLQLGDLKENKFLITVRCLKKKDLEKISLAEGDLKAYGVLNYFDSQRFGSVIKNKFIAKHVLKEEYESAVKIFLTEYSPHEPRSKKEDKRALAKVWPSFKDINLSTRLYKKIIEGYIQTKSWKKAYLTIPRSLRLLHSHAYQSYLWNECVKKIVKSVLAPKEYSSVQYAVGCLFFHKKDIILPFSSFPLIGKENEYTTEEKKVIDQVLTLEDMHLDDFKYNEMFHTQKRDLILKPKDFVFSIPERDECNGNDQSKYFKVTLSFSLHKGSYATLITKRLFGK